MEIWRDVIGFEGLYQVSNLGRVKNVKFGYDRILSPSKKHKDKGYLKVDLYKKNQRQSIPIHRLVITAFVCPCPEGCNQVDHIDGNPSNNCVENLRWCDSKSNNNTIIHRKRISEGCSGIKHKPMSDETKEKIRQKQLSI